jgi:hypothetical protein
MTYSLEIMSDQDSPETQSVSIADPNIDDPEELNRWLDQYVQKPFLGYEDKKHPNGTPFTLEEQTEASRDQLRQVARDFKLLKRPKTEIQEILKESVVELQENSST